MPFRLPVTFVTEFAHRMTEVQNYDCYIQRMKVNALLQDKRPAISDREEVKEDVADIRHGNKF